MLLHELDKCHELRNKPLGGMECRNKQQKEWREVKPNWAIASVTYNDLGDAWTDTTEFRSAA